MNTKKILAGLIIWVLFSTNFATAQEDQQNGSGAELEPRYTLFGTARAGGWFSTSDPDLSFEDATIGWENTIEAHHQLTGLGFEARADHLISLGNGLASSPDAAPTLSIWEAYLMARPFEGFDLSFGQKRLAFGLGALVNPADTLHPRESGGAKTGYKGITGRVSIGQELGLSAALSVDQILAAQDASLLPAPVGTSHPNPWHHASWAALAEGQYDSLNIGATYLYGENRTQTILAWLSYDIEGIILGLEISTDLAFKEPSPILIIEAKYQETLDDAELGLTLDYLYYGPGTSSGQAEGINGTTLQVMFRNRHYVAASASLGWTDLGALSASTLISLEDASARNTMALRAQLADAMDLECTVAFLLGHEGDEFIPAGQIRLQPGLGLILQW